MIDGKALFPGFCILIFGRPNHRCNFAIPDSIIAWLFIVSKPKTLVNLPVNLYTGGRAFLGESHPRLRPIKNIDSAKNIKNEKQDDSPAIQYGPCDCDDDVVVSV